MTIEIVDFPIKNGDFPVRYVKLPEGTACFIPCATGFQLSIQKTCGRSCASACPEVPSAAFGSLAGPLAGPSMMHYKNKHPNRFLKNGELDVLQPTNKV